MSEGALETVLRRDRAVVIAALVMLTVLAWGYTAWLANSISRMSASAMIPSTMSAPTMPMDGMSMGAASQAMPSDTASIGMGTMLAPTFAPWTAPHVAFMVAMWAVMMVGMMLPSAAPVILIYARVGRQAAAQHKPFAATGFFAGGYLLAWAVFSLFATAAQWLLERVALLTPMMTTTSALFGGLVLIAAGLFQWTPLKDSCLKHCQAPLTFIQHHGGFRRDPLGALAIGFRHGLYCVGCCWALMALLFVGGVMNSLWIAMLALFVLLEKLVPSGRIISRIAGVGLMAWGAWLLTAALH
jgi:predicted metal-binding membrane protein